MSGQSDERSAADIAAVGPDDGDADTLRGGLLYHRYYISGVRPSYARVALRVLDS